MQRIILIGLTALLTACANQPSQQAQGDNTTLSPVTTYYDYQLASNNGQPIALNQLPSALTDADVVLIGEWHTHSAVHRFQTDFLKARLADSKDVALSMEQFTRQHQDIIDDYLAGEIGEQVLMSDAAAWPNYQSDYRPLVELAKSQGIDIIAANAPKPVVQCIGRNGIDYLEKLTPEERQWVADEVNTNDSPYKEKFMASMHHGTPEQTEKQFAAQVTWDETMADSIVKYLDENPDTQVVHVAGKFHTEQGLVDDAGLSRTCFSVRGPKRKFRTASSIVPREYLVILSSLEANEES